ncbi:MAG: hypothetical protein K6T65_04505 [Peptococcaceae bacterium]|nr:hypothetical protein [Peptococcaceae bacterium]
MALLDGGTVTVNGSFIKEGDSYSLSYLLAGHRDKTAVITGLHLKLLPSSPSESGMYMVVAAFSRPGDAFDTASSLSGCGGIKKCIAFDTTFVSPPTEYLKNLFSGTDQQSAYLLITLEGDTAQLDPAAREIAETCHRGGALEIFVAADTYQKEMVNTTFNSILAALAAWSDLIPGSGPGSQREGGRRLKALFWQTGPELRKAFYGT